MQIFHLNYILMVAYLTNNGFWIQLISNKGYVILQGLNLFLAPTHDSIHNSIWDWTRKWDPALNTSTV